MSFYNILNDLLELIAADLMLLSTIKAYYKVFLRLHGVVYKKRIYKLNIVKQTTQEYFEYTRSHMTSRIWGIRYRADNNYIFVFRYDDLYDNITIFTDVDKIIIYRLWNSGRQHDLPYEVSSYGYKFRKRLDDDFPRYIQIDAK